MPAPVCQSDSFAPKKTLAHRGARPVALRYAALTSKGDDDRSETGGRYSPPSSPSEPASRNWLGGEKPMVNPSDPGAIGSVRAWNLEPGSALYSMPSSELGSRKAPPRFCSLMGDDPALPLTSSPVPFVRSMARPSPRPPELMNEKSVADFLASFFFALALADALAFPAAAFPAPSFLALAPRVASSYTRQFNARR